jgi:hypothetical protein
MSLSRRPCKQFFACGQQEAAANFVMRIAALRSAASTGANLQGRASQLPGCAPQIIFELTAGPAVAVSKRRGVKIDRQIPRTGLSAVTGPRM